MVLVITTTDEQQQYASCTHGLQEPRRSGKNTQNDNRDFLFLTHLQLFEETKSILFAIEVQMYTNDRAE